MALHRDSSWCWAVSGLPAAAWLQLSKRRAAAPHCIV